MMATNVKTDAQPWYRQFWLWVVLTPLITVVCVSAVMVSIAFYYADDVVIDNYYKQGRMINQSLEQDRRALALGLRAQLQFDRLIGEVVVTVKTQTAQATALPEKLLLSLDHRFEADLDQQIVVQQLSPGRYRGELLVKPEYQWYLSLSPALDKSLRREAEWILSGEINFAQAEDTELTPRVSE
jgi:hypothetical protein